MGWRHGRASIYHPSSSSRLAPRVFTLLVVFGSNTSACTATVTVASQNNRFVCKMQCPIASRCCMHSNCVSVSILGPPNPHLTFHRISALTVILSYPCSPLPSPTSGSTHKAIGQVPNLPSPLIIDFLILKALAAGRTLCQTTVLFIKYIIGPSPTLNLLSYGFSASPRRRSLPPRNGALLHPQSHPTSRSS